MRFLASSHIHSSSVTLFPGTICISMYTGILTACVSFLWQFCECGVAVAGEVCLSNSQPLRVNQEEMVAGGAEHQQAEYVGHGSFFS